MAMNKYGRATKMTTYPPDKVVKNKDGTTTTTSGKTSVTMSDWIQPKKTPAPKGYISQDDYNAYEAKRREVMGRNAAKYKPYNDAMAAYQQEQDDYKAGMEQYKRATDFYNQGPEPEKEEPGSVKISKGGKTRKGEDTTFESAPRYSAAQSNADLKRAMKENKNIVDINDKSINPAAKKIWMEQLGEGFQQAGTANLYGRTTGKMYVDRDAINKIKSNRDIWGEDFDTVEWDKASKGKNFDKYLAQKGYKNRTFAANSDVGIYQEYRTPQMPGKPTSKMPVKPVIEEEPIPEKPKEKVFLDKMPTRKVLNVESTAKAKYGKLNEKIEEGEWEEPTGGKFKRKGEIQKSGKVEAKGPKGAGGGRSASVNLSIFSKRIKTENTKGGYGIQRGPGSGKSKGLRAREEKMAKSFYAPTSEQGRGGYYSSMEDVEGDVSKAIRSDVKDIRAERKEWKGQTSLTGSEKRAGDREMFKGDIQTGRLSARYAKRGDLRSLDVDPDNPNANELWKEGKKSKLKIYTPDLTKRGNDGAMYDYVSSAEKNIEAAKMYGENERTAKSNQIRADFNKQSRKNYGEEGYIQKAEDNATNRNTIKAKMENYKGWNRFVQ